MKEEVCVVLRYNNNILVLKLLVITFYFRLDKSTKELKDATPYIARFDDLNSKFGQTLTDNKNLKDANKASI